MAKCKLLMQTAQTQKLIDFFDGYEDDKVKCKFIKKTGIKAEIECETELTPDEAAGPVSYTHLTLPTKRIV